MEKPGSGSYGLNPSPQARTSSCVLLGKLQCLSEFSSAFVRKRGDCVGSYFTASSGCLAGHCPGMGLILFCSSQHSAEHTRLVLN